MIKQVKRAACGFHQANYERRSMLQRSPPGRVNQQQLRPPTAGHARPQGPGPTRLTFFIWLHAAAVVRHSAPLGLKLTLTGGPLAKSVCRFAAIIVSLTGLAAQPATAAPINTPHRAYVYYQYGTYGGANIDGVTGRIYVRNNVVYSTGTSANVNLWDYKTGYTNFIQAGVVEGNAKLVAPDETEGPCSDSMGGYPSYAAATFFVGYFTEDGNGGMWCESLVNLGQFGSTGNYRQIGIRHAGGGYWYVTLDGVEKWRKLIPGLKPGNLRPQFSGEANDNCTDLYARAEGTSTPISTLSFHTAGGAWRFWPSGALGYQLREPTRYTIKYPHGGTYAASLAYGPSPRPAGC